MTKKSSKLKKIVKSKKAVKGLHLVIYVENSNPCSEEFTTEEKAVKFVQDFMANKHSHENGNWIDFIITDIKGAIHYLDKT